MPTHWNTNIEGWKCASWILHDAKNLGWEKTLVYGKAVKYFDDSNAEWFCEGQIFSSCKPLSSKVMKGRYNDFEGMVKRQYVLQNHSTDTTGAMGEKIVPEIRLCMEFLDFDAAHRERNSQTGKKRRMQ